MNFPQSQFQPLLGRYPPRLHLQEVFQPLAIQYEYQHQDLIDQQLPGYHVKLDFPGLERVQTPER